MLEDQSKFNCKRIKTLTNRILILVYGENEKDYSDHQSDRRENEWLICNTILDKNKENYLNYSKLRKEVYPLKNYSSRIHLGDLEERKKRRVKFLDRIVSEVNTMLEDYSKFNYQRIKTLFNRADTIRRLIYK